MAAKKDVGPVADPESLRNLAFYTDLCARLGSSAEKVVSVVVAHPLPDSQAFFWAINEIALIAVLLPKPKSAASESGQEVLEQLSYRTEPLGRFVDDVPDDNGHAETKADKLAKFVALIKSAVPDDTSFVLNDIDASSGG
jgi:hypothetical protein